MLDVKANATEYPAMLVKRQPQIDAALEHLTTTFDEYSRWRRAEQEDGWNACYRAYKGFKPQTDDFYHVYKIREIFRQVETLKPLLAEQFFGGGQLFRFKSRHEGNEDRAQAATEIVHMQLDAAGGRNALAIWDWLDTAILYGTSYIVYGWQTWRRPTHKILRMHDPEDGKSWWKRETDEILEEGPYVRHFSPFHVWTHPEIADPRDSPVCFVEEAVSLADIKTLIREGYLDAAAVKDGLGTEDGGRDIAAYLEAEGPEDAPRLQTESGLLSLRSCWTNDAWEYAVLDRRILGRATKIPFGRAPLLALRNYPLPEEHYGTPEPLLVLEEQNLLDDFMSIFADGLHYAANPMFQGTTEQKKTWLDTVFQPGGFVATVPNAPPILPLQTNSQMASLMQLPQVAAFILNNARMTPGITAELSGIGSTSSTATQHVRLQEAATKRIEGKIRRFMPMFRQLYGALYELNRLYLDTEVAVRLEGDAGREAFQTYLPTVFDADVDVEVELANERTDEGPEASMKWQNALRTVGGDPLVERRPLLERFFRSLGVKKPALFISDPTTATVDANAENAEFIAWGETADPKMSDNDQAHLAVHMPLLMEPVGAAEQNPTCLQRHCRIHQDRMAAKTQAAGAYRQQNLAPGSGSPVPATDVQTEAMFGNAERGAASQGGVPEAPALAGRAM